MLQLDAELLSPASSWIDCVLPRCRYITKSLRLPLAVKAGKTPMTGEELLHGGLFEVALLGDEPVQRTDQGVDVVQCFSDGFLFDRFRRPRQLQAVEPTHT